MRARPDNVQRKCSDTDEGKGLLPLNHNGAGTYGMVLRNFEEVSAGHWTQDTLPGF